jgi:cobyrinic acid a,c-diamide synthase
MELPCERHVEAGQPVLAECGGMMSLFESVSDKAGVSHDFAGLLPGHAVMQKRLTALGMQSADLPEGRLQGHTFHYSKSETPLLPLCHAQRRPMVGQARRSTARAV